MVSRVRKKRGVRLSVREAKNRFSDLLHRAAKGEEIVVTSHGEPRARLTGMTRRTRPFRVDWKWLRGMTVAEPQTPAEALVRVERDSRD